MSALSTSTPSLEDSLREVANIEAALKQEKKKRKKEKEKEKEKEKGAGSVRGIETMFRTTFQSHNDLVALADNKANMMISVNGLIISILLASLSPSVDESGWLVIPTATLLIGCFGSLVFGVLAARPRVTRNPTSLEDVRTGRANLLFFGNFLSMPMEDYLQGMRLLMENPDDAYMHMVRNLYALGHILEKKFRLLWLSYTIFLAGLASAVLVSVIVLIRWIASAGAAIP
jgi:hypothetical protein